MKRKYNLFNDVKIFINLCVQEKRGKERLIQRLIHVFRCLQTGYTFQYTLMQHSSIEFTLILHSVSTYALKMMENMFKISFINITIERNCFVLKSTCFTSLPRNPDTSGKESY